MMPDTKKTISCLLASPLMMKKVFIAVFVFSALALSFSLQTVLAADKPEISYQAYTNAFYQYSVEYPDIFSIKKGKENSGFITFETKDDEYSLTIWIEANQDGTNGELWLGDPNDEIAHIMPDSAKSGDKFYTVEYSDDGGQDGVEHIFHEYGIVGADGEVSVAYRLSYPKSDEERFTAVKKRMDESLKIQASASDNSRSLKFSAFSKSGADGDYVLRHEKVFYQDRELTDAFVHEVDIAERNDASSVPIYYWSFIDNVKIKGVPPADMGVRFFDKDGVDIFFIPLELRADCQDIVFSPNGQWILLMGGSPMRPDKIFALYKFFETDIKEEFASHIDAFIWIDPIRFVFTRLDDIRELGTFANLGYGVEFSAVLYDTATAESIVLKKADETHNYYVDSLIKNENALKITEESVPTEQDWGNEDKIKSHTIHVEIPAAG